MMIETLVWWTGQLVWAVILVIAALLLPVAAMSTSGYLLTVVGLKLDDRYYDGIESVKQAKKNETWFYYVIHYTFSVRDRLVEGIILYDEWVLQRTVGPLFEAIWRAVYR